MTEEQQILAALAGTDRSERYSALIALGKAGLRQHEKRIAGYLDETDSGLRSAAIRVLAFYWRLPAYRKTAESMMLDQDAHVRAVAVMSWASYGFHTRDQDILRHLYQILVDDNQPRQVRDAAYGSFFSVFEPNNVGLPKPALQLGKSIDECIDWRRLDAAVESSGAWQPSAVAMQSVTHIGYSFEGAELVLTRDTVEITRSGNVVRGKLAPASWIRALGAMELGGFPMPSAGQEGERITLKWTRNREVECVAAFATPSKYRDIIRVASELIHEHQDPEPVPSHATAVSTIEVSRGSVDEPRGGMRRLRLYSDERFEFLFQHHDSRRAWEGTLRAGTFEGALAVIRAAGFPDAGPERDLVPGEQTRSVAIERGGSWERVSVYEEDARYTELIKLSSSVLASLDETLARMPSAMTSPVVDAHPV